MATFDATQLEGIVKSISTSLTQFNTVANSFQNTSQAMQNAMSILVGSLVNFSNKVNATNVSSSGGGGGRSPLKLSSDSESLIELGKWITQLIAPVQSAQTAVAAFGNSLVVASNDAQIAGTFISTAMKLAGTALQRFPVQLGYVKIAIDVMAKAIMTVVSTFNALQKIGTGLYSVFQSSLGIVTSFVSAFNPALVEQLSFTIRDLTAVIGSVLQPILMAFNAVIRRVADALVPLAVKLAPAFNAIAGAILALLIPIIDSLGSVLLNLVPVFNQLTPIIVKLATMFGELFSKIIDSLAPTIVMIGEMFVSLVQSAMPLVESFIFLAETIIPLLDDALLVYVGYLVSSAIPAIISFAMSLVSSTIPAVISLAAYLTSTVIPAIISFATNLYTGGIPAIIAMAQSIYATLLPSIVSFAIGIATVAAPFVLIGLAILAVIAALVALASWLGFFKKEQKKEATQPGASFGAGARKAEYSSVTDLSRNLMKSAFSGTGNDALRSIDINIKKQVKLMEEEANAKKKPQPVAIEPGLEGRKPGMKA